MYHYVHLADHRDIVGNPYGFLAANDDSSPSQHDVRGNGLRASDWSKIFSGLDFDWSEITYADDINLFQKSWPHQIRTYDRDDLLVNHYLFFGHRRNTASHRIHKTTEIDQLIFSKRQQTLFGGHERQCDDCSRPGAVPSDCVKFVCSHRRDRIFRNAVRLLLMPWTAPPPARECHGCGCWQGPHNSKVPNMQAITTLGLDIAKSVFQVHGVDTAGKVIIRRQLKRRYVLAFFQKLPPCLVGIDACAGRGPAGYGPAVTCNCGRT